MAHETRICLFLFKYPCVTQMGTDVRCDLNQSWFYHTTGWAQCTSCHGFLSLLVVFIDSTPEDMYKK